MHTHLAVQRVFCEPSVSITWELMEMRDLKLRSIRICILTSFSMTPLHAKIQKLCHRFLNNCSHLLTGLSVSTLAPLEFILLRYYCGDLSMCQSWACQKRLKKDETTFWRGQSSQTVEHSPGNTPCGIGNWGWRNHSVHVDSTRKKRAVTF